ncbi:TPM domain-containing protein [Rufibacter tibetensis]|uniref:TPM domain-containing protein n=1 Tax=Rufibacter tibetensis TaxID=512763 RepID=A0A0P0D0Z2_9BACT|nr:TPM domain-containing protein [Rufibacter tibetensis]ALJ01413.1 hypothetical protein DC20_12150 [Rufibacter tibetensis]
MRCQKAILFLLIILSYISSSCTTQETESQNQSIELASSDSKARKFPKPIGYINDFENVFTDEQEQELTKLLTGYNQETTNAIAVITVSSIEPYSDFDQYALEISEEWGVGEKGKDNGLTILFSKKLQRIRISTGLGTERILTNEVCQRIIDHTIVPKLKEGKFFEGISSGLVELIEQWKQTDNHVTI